MKLNRIFLATIVVAIVAMSGLAQDRKKMTADEQSMYVVSAKAGVVNIIEGDVSIKSGDQWNRLIAGDDLQIGSTVKTASSGRVEILLNPGCFLRLAQDSEFAYTDSDMSGTRLNLIKGSMIIEAAALDGPITITKDKIDLKIVREGLYRFNVTQDGKAEVAVRKGAASVATSGITSKALVKDGKKAAVENDSPVIAKFDKKVVDDFDTWSKDRAKSLIAINKRLSQKGMKNNGLLTSIYSVWVYDPICRCRTWLPGTYGFASPYGWSYSSYNPFWYRFDPWYYSNYGRGYSAGNNNSGGGGGGTSNSGGGQSGGGARPPSGGFGGKDPGRSVQPTIHPPSRGDSGGGFGGGSRGGFDPGSRGSNTVGSGGAGTPSRQKGIKD